MFSVLDFILGDREGEGDGGSGHPVNWENVKWGLVVFSALTYAILAFVLGPAVDERFEGDTCSAAVMNYVMNNRFAGESLWRTSARDEARYQSYRHPKPPDDSGQAHLVSEAFMRRSVYLEDWDTPLSDPSARKEHLLDKETRKDAERHERETKRKKKNKRDLEFPKEGLTLEVEGEEDEETLVEASALFKMCTEMPEVFHPRAMEAYYLDEDCGAASSRDVSQDRLNEIMEAYSPGSSVYFKGRPALLRSWFEVLSIASWCSSDVVTDQMDHVSPKPFVAYALVKSSVCFQKCRRRNAERHRRHGAMDASIEDPWLAVEWSRGENNTLHDAVVNVLRALYPNSGYRALQSFRPRYAWVYSCDLRREILERGSVVVVFDVVWEMLVNYREGVYTHEGIDVRSPAHESLKRRVAVVLVGWGSERVEGRGFVRYFVGTMPYGKAWGDQGYLKIAESDLAMGNGFSSQDRNFLVHGVYTLVVDVP